MVSVATAKNWNPPPPMNLAWPHDAIYQKYALELPMCDHMCRSHWFHFTVLIANSLTTLWMERSHGEREVLEVRTTKRERKVSSIFSTVLRHHRISKTLWTSIIESFLYFRFCFVFVYYILMQLKI